MKTGAVSGGLVTITPTTLYFGPQVLLSAIELFKDILADVLRGGMPLRNASLGDGDAAIQNAVIVMTLFFFVIPGYLAILAIATFGVGAIAGGLAVSVFIYCTAYCD